LEFERREPYGSFHGFTLSFSCAPRWARELLTKSPLIPIDAIKAVSTEVNDPNTTKAEEERTTDRPCPCCGGHMIIIERFARGSTPHHQPSSNGRNQDRHFMTAGRGDKQPAALRNFGRRRARFWSARGHKHRISVL
jgi:hypothetical protein